MTITKHQIPREEDSKSAWIRYYTVQLLEDENMHYIPDIMDHIENSSGKKFGKDFTRAMLTGVLDRLVKSGDYINMDPGVGLYCKAFITITEDIEEVCNKIFDVALEKVYKKLEELDVLTMTSEDFRKVQLVKEKLSLIESQILKEKTILLSRDYIIKLLDENNQNPQILRNEYLKPNTNTIVNTNTKGVFYILEYNAGGRIGWSLSESRINEIKSYDKYAIVFLNQNDGEIFIVIDDDKSFYNSLVMKKGSCRIGRKDLYNLNSDPRINYKISEENLVEFFST